MATTFTVFSRLSLERRGKVWRCALLLFPRIIELKSVKSINEFDKHSRPRWFAIPNSKPTLLSVNPPFQARRISPHPGIEGLLISYHIDTLFINTDFRPSSHSDVLFRDLFGSYFVEIQNNLKRIACVEDFWVAILEGRCQRRFGIKRTKVMNEFTNLEEAIVVAKRFSRDYSIPRKLSHFEELPEGSEDWPRLEKDRHLFFHFLGRRAT
ncbi:hypothetical protein N431DRAFT_498040 [Stipitochalara longipes BDJ]|nr:hypothetical protein N431DRAFT_498040 [Stipitochalara longipes BDJ]